MNLFEASLFVLLISSLSSSLSEKLHLPVEVFLLLGSCAVSLIPGLPIYEIDPYYAFVLFLPPILFHAAYFTSWREFKRNRRPIAFLAVGLVLFTSAAIAVVAKTLFPHFTWAQGFLLGAIVSPPDAAAATSIVKKLGAPRRLITVLEGESLVNDATALVIYRFALTAILVGSFSLGDAILQFFYISVGGLVVGYVIASIFFYILKRMQDTNGQTILSVITAFACYIVAERLGVSGIISTVVGGLFFGKKFPELKAGKARVETMSVWKNIIFIVNGFIFTLIGFQLPVVLKNLEPYSLGTLLFYGLLTSFAVVLIRLIWVFTATYLPWYLFPHHVPAKKSPQWRVAAAIGWIGMRGIVSLAAVLAIPTHLPNGDLFPDRGIFIFITYCVIIFTLVTPALTVPKIFKLFNLRAGIEQNKEEALARLKALEGVLTKISSWEHSGKFPTHLLEDVKKHVARKMHILTPQSDTTPFSAINEEYFALRRISKELLESERSVLFQLRREGQIHDEIFHIISEELDVEEMRLKSLRV